MASSSTLPLLLLISLISVIITSSASAANTTSVHELVRGFRATLDPSLESFQPLLSDPTSTFSFGFLKLNGTHLTLAVLHAPSSQPLWLATATRWSKQLLLTFNGSLVIMTPNSVAVWSTYTNGDRVIVSNTSNLQIQAVEKSGNSPTTLWQSFDFPTDTLIEGQNLTANISLTSPNGQYQLKLGENFFGLYARFGSGSGQMYWKHAAMEIKAKIVEGEGPIYLQIHSDGYIGTYQTSSTPVDIQPFNSFHRSVDVLLIIRLESDGNLKGYSWNGSAWELNYQAIQNQCDLPSPCGPYGICDPGKGCSCVDEKVKFSSLKQCSLPPAASVCGGSVSRLKLSLLRKTGVELVYKEYMDHKTTSSLEGCEKLCDIDCGCLAAVYSNSSGFCYILENGVEGLVSVGDEAKVGYFKVWEDAGEGGDKVGTGFKILVGIAVAVGVVLVAVAAAVGFLGYKRLRIRKEEDEMVVQDAAVGTGLYKHLDSFRSIELSTRSVHDSL